MRRQPKMRQKDSRRPLGSRRSRDAGVSLVEFAVAGALAAVVVSGALAVFTGSLQSVRMANVKTSTTADVRVAMESVTRSLRMAVVPAGLTEAVTVADDDTISFYTLVNRTGAAATADLPPTLVKIFYDGTCLKESHYPAHLLASPGPNGPFYDWNTTPSTKCLMRTSVAPRFTYFDTGELTSGGTDVDPLPLTAGSLSATDRESVRSVQLVLTGKSSDDPGVQGVSVLDRVTLTNVVLTSGAQP